RRRTASAHRLCRRSGRDDLDRHGQTKRTAAALSARDLEFAAHGLGDALYENQAEPGTAVAPRHLGARLRERTEQLLQFGCREPDAAVADREYQPHALACGRLR